MKEEQNKQIVQHGLNLIKLFKLSSDTDALNLCRKLRRLENKAYKITLRQCNKGIDEEDQKNEEEILNKVDKLLNFKAQGIKVFINGDARGHALKISDKHKELLREVGFFIDWGGYGIIAPEIN